MDEDLDQRREELFEALGEQLQERLSADEAAKAERFVRLYYAGAANADLLARDPLTLYASALDHYRLARDRAPGRHRLRVYNPDLERDGWHSTHTVVTVVTDDMPFLVDSMTAAFARRGLAIHLLVHPILLVHRDDTGRLVDVEGAGEGAQESFMRFEVDQLGDDAQLRDLADELDDVLADIRAAVEDWRAMLAAVERARQDLKPARELVNAEVADEIAAFLTWLAEDHFTFLGYGRYALVRRPDGLHLEREPEHTKGILKHLQRTPSQTFSKLPAEIRERAADPREPLILTKANTRSTVHRNAYLDYVGVKRYAEDGSVVGEHRFLGLFTAGAYNRTPRDIPLLRRKVRRLIERSGVRPGSHDGKALLNVLETYPRDELFQADEDTLARFALDILHLRDRQRLRLFIRHDPFGRFAACLVFVPRERYTTEIRRRFEATLRAALGGSDVQFETRLGEDVLARILFIIRVPPERGTPEVDVDALEAELRELSRTWTDRLLSALVEAEGEAEGHRRFQLYGGGIPAGYQESTPPRLAVPDLDHVARLARGEGPLRLSLYRPIAPGSDLLRFKLVCADRKIPLARALPILADMGLTVLDEQPHRIRDVHGRDFWLHDFGMAITSGADVDVEQVRERFHDAFARIWAGEVEDDGFNRLVLLAGLDARAVQILRAYCRYMLQIKIPFSQAYIEDTLAHHPEIARALADYFQARFDPDFPDDRTGAVEATTARINALLEGVAVRDEDIIVRAYREVMAASLRTNAYQPDAEGRAKPYLSIKVDPARIRLMPEPRPAFEIFVHSVRFEGVHLRGGKVARGGIRWSDRREDFRTEILGLMKAQQVKNSIIVPVGAKGGFVLKRAPLSGGREALQAEGVSCYKLFLSGLLDLTDNRKGDTIEPPAAVVRWDDDDPYLVVAADKGTATFSDIANEVARSYDFWLDDAFASGGSAGYDHKRMGITAKGAWESVKRHFRELGRDCQRQPFSCVGIGDMSGDVFGNGMLLSRQTRLVAAFDHRHIFIDPTPDAETSYGERERLFALARSSWDDYDRARISRGGGIWPRSAKTIQLSADAKRALGVHETTLAPSEVIKAILKAPVDLLWNGGIGTYVKASTERHAEAEDRANDAVRVDAAELGCKIVGEGGNLGLTQRARIEFAMNGGRINTDSIDNSAGVDCSDHEVNIKILLGRAVRAGDLTLKHRDELLAEMTDEVAELCLRDNVLQNFALSIAQAMPPDYLDAQASLMHRLEADGALDRALQLLPGEDELTERRQAGFGLTRPEMSVLLALTKNRIYEQVLASDVVDEGYLETDLQKYFPRPLRRRFAAGIRGHGLRREIVATWLTNSMINRGLDVFVDQLMESTGRDVADIARAYVITRDAFALVPLWTALEELESCEAARQIDFLKRTRRVTLDGTAWFLAHLPPRTSMADAVGRFRAGIDEVVAVLPETLTGEGADHLERELDGFARAGLDAENAHRLAALPYFMAACDIVEVAGEAEASIRGAAATYFALDAALSLGRVRRWLETVAIRNRWDRLAAAGLADDLYRELRRLSLTVLAEEGEKAPAERVQRWVEANRRVLPRLERLFADIASASVVDLSMVAVAIRALGDLGKR